MWSLHLQLLLKKLVTIGIGCKFWQPILHHHHFPYYSHIMVSLLAKFGSSSRVVALEHFSQINTKPVSSVQATTGGIWIVIQRRLGSYCEPNSHRLCLKLLMHLISRYFIIPWQVIVSHFEPWVLNLNPWWKSFALCTSTDVGVLLLVLF